MLCVIITVIPTLVVRVTATITAAVSVTVISNASVQRYLLALDVDVAVLADHAFGGDAKVLRAVRVPPVLQPALLVVLAACRTHSYICTEGSNWTQALRRGMEGGCVCGGGGGGLRGGGGGGERTNERNNGFILFVIFY